MFKKKIHVEKIWQSLVTKPRTSANRPAARNMTFRHTQKENHCCALRLLLTSRRMFTAIFPSALNVSNFFGNSNKNRKTVSSPFLSSPLWCTVCSLSRTRPTPRQLLADAPPLLHRCVLLRALGNPHRQSPVRCSAGRADSLLRV